MSDGRPVVSFCEIRDSWQKTILRDAPDEQDERIRSESKLNEKDFSRGSLCHSEDIG